MLEPRVCVLTLNKPGLRQRVKGFRFSVLDAIEGVSAVSLSETYLQKHCSVQARFNRELQEINLHVMGNRTFL